LQKLGVEQRQKSLSYLLVNGKRRLTSEYQEALFTKAMPPQTLAILGEENRLKGGIIKAYIYRRFAERFTQLSSASRL
jgi:HaeII restriction endonuclease